MDFFLFRKIFLIGLRAYHIIVWFPKRAKRLLRHLWLGLQAGQYNWWPENQKPKIYIRILFWWWELILYFGDLLGVTEIFESLLSILKINSRALTKQEVKWSKQIFGETIPLKRIEIDNRALLGPPWWHFAYVSGFTINSWGTLGPTIFLHELTHVWQYHQVGLVYIARALWAQSSKAGYDYGGPANIMKHLQRGELLESFNYEQQAEIVADYYRILNNRQPQYHHGCSAHPSMFTNILRSLDEGIV